MNREQRRQAARAALTRPTPHDQDCGCCVRRLFPILDTDCPACGRPSRVMPPEGRDMPTSAPFGATIDVELGCSCGTTYSVPCLVD